MKALTTICVVMLAALSLTITQVQAFDSATDSETEESEEYHQKVLGGSSNPGVSLGSTMNTIPEIPSTQSQIDPAAQDPVWVLDEIYIADTSSGCGESPFNTPLPLNTNTLTRKCSNEHESGWANMVLTLNFNYPQQISYGNQGTFTANASLELDQFSSKGTWAMLSLELKGELWSYSPKCKKEDETREDFGPGEPVFTILEVGNLSCDFQALCEPNCDYTNAWWSGGEAVFLFDVDSSAGGVSPGFYLWLKYKRQSSVGPFTLYITPIGDGSGKVVSKPQGINCTGPGSDCNEEYPAGTSVTLTAIPYQGSTFTGWSGNRCTGREPCTVIMDRDLGITATFEWDPPFNPTTRLLDVAIIGKGTVKGDPPGTTGIIDCRHDGGDCAEFYFKFTKVTLTAYPADGWWFIGWKGDIGCPGTSPCTVSVDTDKTVSAVFTNEASTAYLHFLLLLETAKTKEK